LIFSALYFGLTHGSHTSNGVALKDHVLLGSELGQMGEAVAVHATRLCNDQRNRLHGLMTLLNAKVLAMHGDAGLDKSMDKYLQASNNALNQVEDTALGLIRGAVSLILLYVPDRPFDPSLPAKLLHQLWTRQSHELREKHHALVTLATMTLGQSSSLRSRMVGTELNALGDEPAITTVARPQQSQLQLLQADFSNLLNLVQRICRDLDDVEALAQRADEYVRGLHAVVKRLSGDYKAYEDITRPAIGFVAILKLGMVLLAQERPHTCTDAQKKAQAVLTHTPFMQEVPGSYAIRAPTLELRRDTDLILHDLHLLVFRSQLMQPARWSAEAQDDLVTFFSLLYSVWETQLTKEQKEAAANRDLYEHKGSKEDEEAEEEEEMRRLFPSYEEDDDDEDSPAKKVKSLNLQNVTPRIALHHMHIFGVDKDETTSITSLLSSAADIIGKSSEVDGMPRTALMQDLLPAMLIKTMEQQQSIKQEGQSTRQYNIYVDLNLTEAKKVVTLVDAVQEVIRPILVVWPEHATLHDILGTCDELLAFGHAEPVMKYLTKTEKLHAQIAEWQKVASKEYSAATILNKTTDLLISWRQLELSTWARMLDLETEKAEENARKWYFLAYENVIHRPMTMDATAEQMADHTTDLVTSLQDFMKASTMGEYATKLRIISSLQAHLLLASAEKPALHILCSALANFIYHFERFAPSIRKIIDDGRKRWEKDIQNTIKLASWKDRNIETLKQSARKSHRKLFKVMRKYRTILGQPAGPVLAQDVARPLPSIASTELSSTAVADAPDSAVTLLSGSRDVWSARPDRFKEVKSTATLMQRKSTLPPDSFDSSDHLLSFVEELEVSIEQLQKATPATLTEENAASVKHLTARKRKVFADTLKDLRTMGLKSNISVDVLATQSSAAKILATMPALTESEAPGAQDLLARLLDVMPKVRVSHTEHNEDMTGADVARCVGYIESLLVVLLKQRSSIARGSTGLKILAQQLEQIKNVWSDDAVAVARIEDHRTQQLATTKVCSPWLPIIIRGGITVLKAQATLGKLDFAPVIETLEGFAVQFEGLHSQMAALPSMPSQLASPQHLALLESRSEALRALEEQLDQHTDAAPLTGATLSHVKKWVNATVNDATPSNSPAIATPDSSSSELISKHYILLDQVLGSIQDVAGTMQQLPQSAEDQGWLLREDRIRQLMLTSFHTETISQSLDEVLHSISSASSEDQSALQTLCASLAMALPILQQYQAALDTFLHKYIDMHTSTCNLTYRLTRSYLRISSQGFCKPAEATEEKASSGNDKLESGTGLGEGEGADDISKDIGDDEDLDDLAQDPNNKREDNGEGMENEDDAVSIQDELEGAAGESKGKEEEEESKKDDGKENADEDEEGSVGEGGDGGGQEDGEDEAGIDEDMGDVDDLGPSAVDEKMWDQAGDENDKEQESKNTQGEVDKNEQAAGKDEKKTDDKKGEEDAGEGGEDEQEDGDDGDELSDLGSETGGPQEDIAMDPHVKDDEGLELPDELKLDGENQGQEVVEEDFDEDMPDVDGEGEEDEEARPDELDDVKPTDPEQPEDPTADPKQQTGDAELQPEEQGQDEDPEHVDTHDDSKGDSHDQDMTDPDTQAGGGLANQQIAEHDERDGTDADARDNAPEDQKEEQSASASAAQRQTGEEKSGATDQTQAPNAEQAPPDGSAPPQDSSDRQTVKKLGDILEKWHRQQKQIQDVSTDRPEDQAPQDVDMADADFEHLPDEDAQADTQALGASSKEQARALDETMAVETDDRVEEQNIDKRLQNADEEEVSADEADDMDVDQADPSTSAPTDTQADARTRTHIGDRRDMNEPIDAPSPSHTDDLNETDLDDELEHDLDTLALATRAPSPSTPTDPQSLWTHHETRTLPLALTLTEHLRLILAPTLATKLRGDFRTGKRLNIKRIIPYIASSYKRDKIWMRRSVPSKRAYQILIAIDDSRSMAENGSKELAFDTLALVAKALSALEVGEMGVVGFGEQVEVAHDMSAPFSGEAGAKVLSHFAFKQERTNVRKLVERSLDIFREARMKSQGGGGGADLWQLELIVSDGICEEHEGIRRLLLQAMEERIMIVFVVVDAAADAGAYGPGLNQSATTSASTRGKAKQQQQQQQQSSSIIDLEKVEFVAGAEGEAPKVVRTKYLDTFPFGYYLVVKDVRDLPGVLSTALRQWFAEVAER
jgi:midasin